jgi:hypothetical protein
VTPETGSIGGFGVELPDLVGMTTEAARNEAVHRGIDSISVLDSVNGTTVTPRNMDWSPTRLNLIVENGIVVQAIFG